MNLTAWMASINGVIAANAPHPWVIGALWGLCVIDGFFPPVPSESLVVALAAIGHPSRWLIIPVAAAGAICGDNIAYWVGRQIGHTKLFTGGPKRQKTVAWATHQLRVRGPLCILVARYIPGGRVVVNAMAGATRFSYRVFLPIDALAPYFSQKTGVINYGVLGGIVIGLIAAKMYEKYRRTKLPTYLAFFGGRRLVPIVTAAASVVAGVIMAIIYPAFDWLFNKQVGGFIMAHGSNPGTGFVFGTINRLLIPFGLHHLLNSLPWFQLGNCTNAAGETLHGDITCFFSGASGTNAWTGSFMTGFFPIMMFALPGAALAIYHTAKPERKKLTGGVMISVALTAFLTGITEPLEYAFAYVAFPLYLVHALLTGSSLALCNALGIKDGFGFSAGLTDYIINFGRASELSGGPGKVLLLILIGLVYAVIYYVVFRFAITKWNLRTPGREDEGNDTTGGASVFDEAQLAASESTGKADAQKEGRI